MAEPQYATKAEHLELKREMYEGFESVKQNIESLAITTNKSIEKLSEEITGTIQKSMSSDYNLRTEFMKDAEDREKERRQTSLRMIGLTLSLIMMIWSAIWWGINVNDDKKRVEDKLEACKAYHKMEMRVLTLELDK